MERRNVRTSGCNLERRIEFETSDLIRSVGASQNLFVDLIKLERRNVGASLCILNNYINNLERRSVGTSERRCVY